ncbi:winged helix-turn-helix transcriptional regulator [Natronococcus occultus]|uniref:winged helix-turn-helix transcriptional regulator n=1 Tax=Natronococcus occultus TaxID=29288 RepID=UPI0009FC6DED
MIETEIHLTRTDEKIITEIRSNGRATVSLIADIIDRHDQHVRERVQRLEEHGVLVNVAPYLYDTPEQAQEYLPEE